MPNMVIVAIPRAEDPVWKYSSEKKPHCTLLFLGEDQSKAAAITAFLAHAVSILDRGPFGLSVDRRDKLGQDEADVLYFRKDWATKELASFRSTLLKDKNIRDAYDSTEQFPEWNPHLTMGYPLTPAKKDDRDYPGFHWVEFDRIALWTGDYEGPEFRLEYNYDREMEVMMQTAEVDKVIADILEHHGVKGMKWGVRKAARGVGRTIRGVDSQNRSRFNPDFQKEEGRNTGHDAWNTVLGVIVPVYAPATIPSQARLIGKAARAVTGGKDGRQERKFEARANHTKTMVQLHNKAVPDLNAGQKKINAKYKGVNLTDPKNAAKQRKYHQETTDMMAKVYQKHANATTSASGKHVYDVERHGDNIKLVTKRIKHADDEEGVSLTFKLLTSDTGHIYDMKLQPLTHAEEFVEDFLAHYGVKGMKWGQRKPRAAVRTSQSSTLTGKAKAKATGGEGHNASPDAVKVAAKKQKLKKSGVASLSNKDLQDVIERARLETQAREAVAGSGKKFVKKKLGQQVDQQTQAVIREAIKKKSSK